MEQTPMRHVEAWGYYTLYSMLTARTCIATTYVIELHDNQVNRTPDSPTSPMQSTLADWATSVEHRVKMFDS